LKRLTALVALGGALLGCSDRDGSPYVAPGSSNAGNGGTSGSPGRGGESGAADGAGTAGASRNGGASGSGGSPPNASGAAGQGGTDAGGEGATASCTTGELPEVTVFSPSGWDPLGYPPYALDGCNLVYVAPDSAGEGALYRRDLSGGEAELLEPAAARPRRPAVAGDVIAWEIDDEAGKSRVRVSYRGGRKTLGVEFDHAAEPRVTTDAVVFTAFLGAAKIDDSDVYVYDVVDDELTPVATGPGQQRFADVSPTHVALSDFSEDPRGYFDEMASLADVVLVERQSGMKISRAASGKQAFPLLGSDGRLVYLEWGAVHPEPKFSQFWLKAGRVSEAVELDRSLTVEQVHTEPAYVRPSLRGTRVDFIDTRAGVMGLYRATLDGDEDPEPAPIDGAARLLGPVAADSLTLISTPLTGQSLSLVAVER
jgi:hypothetical protein